MRLARSMTCLAGAVCICLAAFVMPCTASVIGSIDVGLGSGDPIQTSHTYISAIGGWMIGPFTVNADADAGAWIKDLGAPYDPLPSSGVYQLVEVLKVGEGLTWNGWHEEILTAGWAWIGGSALIYEPLQGAGTSVSGTVSDDFSRIDFDFNPLGSDTLLMVAKTLEWTGGDDFSSDPIQISESMSVVPIPGAAWMLATGLIGLVVIRRRSLR